MSAASFDAGGRVPVSLAQSWKLGLKLVYKMSFIFPLFKTLVGGEDVMLTSEIYNYADY